MECGEMTTWNKLVQCKWQLLVLTVIWNEVVTVNINNACSARTDGTCVRCDGVPQCFDLSDEKGCTNTTINFVPVKQAARRCTGNGCVDRFPRPPPLPPFSLCKHVQKTQTTMETTAKAPEMSTTTTLTTTTTTSPTTGAVTTHPYTKELDMTTTIAQSNEKAAQTTTLRTELTTTPTTTQTQDPVTTSTQSTPRSTSTCTNTRSTIIPVLSTTQWLPMTTSRPEPIFMRVWWSCSTLYYRLKDTVRCVAIYYWCFRNRNCFRPFRVSHPTKRTRTHPGDTVNNRHTVKTKPKVIPSGFSQQTSSLHISKKDKKEVFPTMSTKTQMLGPKIERTTQPFYPTRKSYFQTPRQPVLTPVTERRLKQISRTSASLHKSDISPLFPKNQRRFINRNPAIFNKQSFPVRATRPTTIGKWYRTTVLPYTATPMVTTTLEPFNNPNFDQYGTTNDDVMYALMVLQYF